MILQHLRLKSFFHAFFQTFFKKSNLDIFFCPKSKIESKFEKKH